MHASIFPSGPVCSTFFQLLHRHPEYCTELPGKGFNHAARGKYKTLKNGHKGVKLRDEYRYHGHDGESALFMTGKAMHTPEVSPASAFPRRCIASRRSITHFRVAEGDARGRAAFSGRHQFMCLMPVRGRSQCSERWKTTPGLLSNFKASSPSGHLMGRSITNVDKSGCASPS